MDDQAAALNRRHFSDGRKPFLGNQNFNGYRATGAANAVDAQDYVTLAQVQALIAGISAVPPGVFIPYTITSSTAPAGWLFANGQTVSRATNATLWSAVATGNNLAATEGAKTAGQYGPGDGSTTFTLPNLYADNGYFIRPISSGRTIGTVQADANKSHTHTGATDVQGNHTHGYTSPLTGDYFSGQNYNPASISSIGNITSTAGAHNHTLIIDSAGDTESRPKNIAYPVIIKT